MAEFTYKNAKNTSTGHTSFNLNYNYHLQVVFEDEVDPYSRSCSADKLAKELKEEMFIC